MAATSTRYVQEASDLGCEVLRQLEHRPPPFLPQARALLFYTSTRVGLGVGFEWGRGFLISRSPYSVTSSVHSEWSPPWFVTVSGAEWGAVAGAERLSVLVGAMSERALHTFTSGPKIALSTNYGVCVPSALSSKPPNAPKHTHPEVLFNRDLCAAAVSAAGAMVDIGLAGTVFRGDKARNTTCYGQEATAATVLGGAVPPVDGEAMRDLTAAIAAASRAALAASFEPSVAGASEFSDEE